jgi:RNA polymerase sigma-70 factor (ECF subfamily)
MTGTWCRAASCVLPYGPAANCDGHGRKTLALGGPAPYVSRSRTPLERYDPDPPAHAVTCPAHDRPWIVANVLTKSDRQRTLAPRQQWRYGSTVKDTVTTQELGQDVTDPDSDQAIIGRVLAGNRDAFRTLISRYSDPLYRHALCMTGSPDVAEDILQMSFIKAFQHLAEVRGRFDAWVFRIVANGCKDWLKNIRRTHLSYDEDDQPSGYATPEEDLDRTELKSDLDRALAALPASLREAFVMKHVEGRSYEEMADLLGTTVGALKMRVHRAREALQVLLEEKYA